MNLKLLIYLFFHFVCFAGEGPELTKWYYDKVEEGSNAHHNLLQVKEFLIRLNDIDTANEIDKLFQREQFYSIKNKDVWNKPVAAEGYTHKAWKSISINEEFLAHGKRLDFLKSKDHFSQVVKLAFIYIHEYYHLIDYKNNVVFSTERPVYQKSFDHYNKLFQEMFLAYQWHVMHKHPDEQKWLSMFRKFASLLAHEFSIYKNGKYGEIVKAYQPYFRHNGCVKKSLKRNELAKYYSELATNFEDNKSYLDNFKAFDLAVRYHLPAQKNPPKSCLIAAQKAIVPTYDLPIGHYGPRYRQRIYKIKSLPAKNYLRILKVDKKTEKAKVKIDVATLGTFFPGQYPIPFNKLSTLQPWVKESNTYFEKATQSIYIIVSESAENSFPSSLSIRFSRKWYDEEGNSFETFIDAKEVPPHMQWEFGYYPVSFKTKSIPFHKYSARDDSYYWSPANGVKVRLKKGDFLRIKSPLVKEERRTITLYKVGPEVTNKQTYNIENVSRMHNWHDAKDIFIKDDGLYYIILNRDSRLINNRFFRIDFELSRNGTSSPDKEEFVSLSENDLKSIGFHTPQTNTIDFYVEWRSDVQSFDHHDFFPMKVFELDTKKGDRIEIVNLPQKRVPGVSYFLKITNTGKIEKVKTMQSYIHKAEIQIQSDEKHYFAYVMTKSFVNSFGFSSGLKHFRSDVKGPTAHFKELDKVELRKLKLFPLIEKKYQNENLTQNHPIGFKQKDMHFQIYKIEIDNPMTVYFQKDLEGLKESHFTFSNYDSSNCSDGFNCLEAIHSGYSWNKHFERTIDSGVYYLTIEGKIKPSHVNEKIPWKIMFRSRNHNPSSVNIEKLNKVQMSDQRIRLKTIP